MEKRGTGGLSAAERDLILDLFKSFHVKIVLNSYLLTDVSDDSEWKSLPIRRSNRVPQIAVH